MPSPDSAGPDATGAGSRSSTGIRVKAWVTGPSAPGVLPKGRLPVRVSGLIESPPHPAVSRTSSNATSGAVRPAIPVLLLLAGEPTRRRVGCAAVVLTRSR
ncbi:hypothetical protein GCM10022197_22240 [Microlunatus spumicola]|uniref:Uncharacterized protein n=1 Tax=Microlunatus spumicola TaxID=81499 RepID=A0ABP6XEC4_9ACTN